MISGTIFFISLTFLVTHSIYLILNALGNPVSNFMFMVHTHTHSGYTSICPTFILWMKKWLTLIIMNIYIYSILLRARQYDKHSVLNFLGDSVVKNPPANTGDEVSIPGLARSLMLQSREAHAPHLLSLCPRVQEPQLLKPVYPRAHAPPQEKPLPWKPMHHPREKPVQQLRPSTAKN